MEEWIKSLEEFCKQYDYGFYGIIKVEKIKLLENLTKAYKETKEDKIHLENLILREYVSKFIIKEELKKAEERYKIYKTELKENGNLKSGMWRHLGEVHMCKKLLGIEKNIVTLDANTEDNSITESDIKMLEENINYNSLLFGYGDAELSGKIRNAIRHLLQVQKETNKENKELWEANAKLAEENTKLNKIIDKMAEYIEQEVAEYQLDEIYASLYKCNGMERNWTRGKKEELEDIKKYFREEAENEKNKV